MSGVFRADPATMRSVGTRIGEVAADFKSNYEKIYSTVEYLIRNNYVSPEAVAIGEGIEGHKSEIMALHRSIEAYSGFATKAGNTVTNNQQNLIDEANKYLK